MNTKTTESIGQVLAATCRTYPDKVALRDPLGDVSYAELERRSNAIANFLLHNNVSQGDKVILQLEQGTNAVAALLGVARVGAVFVPVDGNEPAERLDLIIADSDASLLLASGSSRAGSGTPEGLPVFSIDDALGHADTAPGIDVAADANAYIFYTSGSSGRPKGVCQTHGNLLHFASVYARQLAINADDRLSMLYSLNFSAANMDIFAGIITGACVVFYDLKNRGSEGLDAWLDEERISVLHTVPSVFRHLLAENNGTHIYASIRVIDLGGEAVYKSDIDLLRRNFSKDCRCYNHLAATEASVITQHLVDPDRDYEDGPIPVGKAAEGMRIRVMNEQNEDVAVGETGQIVLESTFITPGYWNLPEKNREVFRSLDDAGEKQFFTGDMGFLNRDGELHCAGRNDFRVKINGQSVEPGEIESRLLHIPGVRDAVVIARQSVANQQAQLTACVVKANDSDITAVSLRRLLRTLLPGYMVPASIAFLDSLPKTATGKTDRRALMQEMIVCEQTEREESDNAGNAVEQAITRLFVSILEGRSTDIIDREHSFFDLGGSSLEAMNLVILLEKNFQVDIPVELLNDDPSIASLAAYIENEMSNTVRSDNTNGPIPLMLPLRKNGKSTNLFVIHGRDGHALISPHFADLLNIHHDIYVFRARGLKHGEKPGLSIEGMAAEYIREIREFQNAGPYYIAGLCVGSVIALEMVKQLSRVGEVVAPVILLDPPYRARTHMPIARKRALVREMYEDLREKDPDKYRYLAENLALRAAEGKIIFNPESDEAIGATAHVIQGLNIAMNTYLALPYHGHVLILCSLDRFENRKKHGDTLLKGKQKFYIVAQTHKDVLDATNEAFEKAINDCLVFAIDPKNHLDPLQAQPRQRRAVSQISNAP